jgi:hypothetical protein
MLVLLLLLVQPAAVRVWKVLLLGVGVVRLEHIVYLGFCWLGAGRKRENWGGEVVVVVAR